MTPINELRTTELLPKLIKDIKYYVTNSNVQNKLTFQEETLLLLQNWCKLGKFEQEVTKVTKSPKESHEFEVVAKEPVASLRPEI